MATTLARLANSFSKTVVSVATKDLKNFSSISRNASLRVSPVLCQNLTCKYERKSPSLPSIGLRYSGLHTEGDRRFVELLDSEIAEENQNSSAVPGMSDGWKITFNGACGTLTKSHDGDNIEVSFTLNGSIPPIEEEEADGGEDSGVVSYPEFNVKVTKPGNPRKIEFECYFPDDVQQGMEDDSMNLFSIRSAVVYEGDISDETYIIETENLDPDVYSFFMSYLADRDIDQQFAEEFIQLTTAAEQREYIKSLKMLKDFIASK